jgi:hypothetical protein
MPTCTDNYYSNTTLEMRRMINNLQICFKWILVPYIMDLTIANIRIYIGLFQDHAKPLKLRFDVLEIRWKVPNLNIIYIPGNLRLLIGIISWET